jgi:hypothetical protein
MAHIRCPRHSTNPLSPQRWVIELGKSASSLIRARKQFIYQPDDEFSDSGGRRRNAVR